MTGEEQIEGSGKHLLRKGGRCFFVRFTWPVVLCVIVFVCDCVYVWLYLCDGGYFYKTID